MRQDAGFWRGKRVLVTGHSGFKGAWLSLWLRTMGAHVTGMSLKPLTKPNLPDLLGDDAWNPAQLCDIRNLIDLKARFDLAKPEIVFHLAAQALVRASYTEPLETFSTNVMGTANVLDAIRGCPSVKVVVVVTTDKVYKNKESHTAYREDDQLGGSDPYSASKAATELIVDSYRASFFVAEGPAVATARAGNVIGGGDWSADRLIPDAVRAWEKGQMLEIRNPDSVRPWQHVLEPLSGYLILAKALWEKPALAGAFNFGPPAEEAASVRDIVELARRDWPGAGVVWGSDNQGPKEAGLLILEASKARYVLGMRPRWKLEEAVLRTTEWYLQQTQGKSAQDLCLADIAEFESA